MAKRLSIGSWAYIFNQKEPTNDFHEILHRMMEMNIGIKNHASIVEMRSVKRSLAMPLRSLLKDPP